MHRSHSRSTYPADKPLPKESTPKDDGTKGTREWTKFKKKFHKRKSRRYLKDRLEKDGE